MNHLIKHGLTYQNFPIPALPPLLFFHHHHRHRTTITSAALAGDLAPTPGNIHHRLRHHNTKCPPHRAHSIRISADL